MTSWASALGVGRRRTFRIRLWGGIGDALLATPALRELKRRFPDATVHVLTHGTHFDLMRHNPHIDILTREGGIRRFIGSQVRFARWFLGRYPRVPRWLTRPLRPEPTELNYTRLAPPSLTGRPATQLMADLLGLTLDDRTLEVWLTEPELAEARAFIGGYPNPVAIHITSSCSANQNWPVENWAALVSRNPQYTFLQFGLANEPRVAGAVDLRGTATIRQSVARLKCVKAFVGVVSSMAHATNATATPAVVLFGPSAPEVWSHANIRVVTRGLRCAPCIDTLYGNRCPYGAPCLAEISVDDVDRALKLQLGAADGIVRSDAVDLPRRDAPAIV